MQQPAVHTYPARAQVLVLPLCAVFLWSAIWVSNLLFISQVLLDPRIWVWFKAIKGLRRILSHPKDVVPMMNKSYVVYRVEHMDCGAFYIGLGILCSKYS